MSELNEKMTKKSPFIIDPVHPGFALQNFNTILNFVGSKGVLVSKKILAFPTKTLLILNQKMAIPIQQARKMPRQISFPHIDILFKTAQQLGFFKYIDEGARKRASLNPSTRRRWNKLNFTEQYFTLLEKWLFSKQDSHSDYKPIHLIDEFEEKILLGKEDTSQTERMKRYKIVNLLAGLELFGLIDIQHAKPDTSGAWKIDSVKSNPAGKFIFKGLGIINGKRTPKFNELMMTVLFQDEETYILPNIFRSSFGKPKNSFSLNTTETINRPGVYFFKVSIGQSWRRIAVVHEATLDDLASLIIKSFNFCDDHLHQFEFLDMNGRKQQYPHSYVTDADIHSDEIRLDELSLSIKGNMKFIYDFGDWWEFKVLLEKIDTNYQLKRSAIIDKKGKAPDQDADWSHDWK